ncbi:MAG: molecular chaperone DnaJ [Acaryochloridaceae cyanobacterium RL_2_7]|nr:molecular chaperone DnaJ [Acaryochloridaceae cyanobacterium RL_2_7]
MSEQTPYQKLDVSEDASFEEIQSARDRLVDLYGDNEQSKQDVEIAYDAILMDRLRRRQAGEIKVPERIRFAEQLAEKKATGPIISLDKMPDGLQRLLDRPQGKEVLISSMVWAGLAGLTIASQGNQDTLSLLMAMGLGFNIFWIQRKELKLGRAVLITLSCVAIAALLAVGLLQLPFGWFGLSETVVVALVAFILFWGASNFLR